MARASTRRCDRVGRVAAARAGLIRLSRLGAIPPHPLGPHPPPGRPLDPGELRGRVPTSLVGSYAQPDWLIDREKLRGRFPPRVRARELWRVDPAYIEEAQDDATRLAIADQERAGLDVITDGEMRRESYSNRFATALDGVDIDNPG